MTSRKPIYFDYAATTPVDPRVAEKMWGYLTLEGTFANPASHTHAYGFEAKEAVELARKQLADLIHADPKEILWTSGATEANNLAILGAMKFYKKKGNHLIAVKTEHKSVIDTCKFLESEGVHVTYLTPRQNGIVDSNDLKEAIQPNTVLVSIMHVNNEIGVIQDIQTLGEICQRAQVFFHVDAAQSLGRLSIDLNQLPVDLMSFSAHKLYGPKGVGALYIRRKPRIRLEPMIYGGGHEQGLRSGTLALHQIVGFGEACRIIQSELHSESGRLKKFRDSLWKSLQSLPQVFLNGSLETLVHGIINFSVAGVEGDALLWAIKDLAVSTGSACTSADIIPSYVLRALGVPDNLAHSSLRLSIGRFTTEEEIDYAARYLIEKITWLRSITPQAGVLECTQKNAFMAEVITPDKTTHLQLVVTIEHNTISKAKFKVLGCPAAIRCLTFITEYLTGSSVDKMKEVNAKFLIETLQIAKEKYSVAGLMEDLLLKLFSCVHAATSAQDVHVHD